MSPIIISNLNFSKQHSLHPTCLPPSDSSNPSNFSKRHSPHPTRLPRPTRPTRLPPLAILRDSLSLSLLPSHRYTLPKFLACAARTILPHKLANSQIITTFAPENSK